MRHSCALIRGPTQHLAPAQPPPARACPQPASVLTGARQGGLSPRDVAQRRADLAQGVAPIDSPPLGALLDLTGRQQLANALAKGINALASAAGCTSPDDNAGCAIADFL